MSPQAFSLEALESGDPGGQLLLPLLPEPWNLGGRPRCLPQCTSLCISSRGFEDSLFPVTVRVGPASILCWFRISGPSPRSPLFKVCRLRFYPILFRFNFCCWKISWLLFFTSCCWESTILWSNFLLPPFPRNLVVSFKKKIKERKNKTFLDPTLDLPFQRVWNEAQVSPFKKLPCGS